MDGCRAATGSPKLGAPLDLEAASARGFGIGTLQEKRATQLRVV